MVDVKQTVPVVAQFAESPLHFLYGIETVHQVAGLLLVDHAFRFPLLAVGVLHISQQEHEVACFAGFQLHVDAVSGYRAPSVSYGIGAFAGCNGIGSVESVVKS